MSEILPPTRSDGWIGLDFGTTNSAVSILDRDGSVRLSTFTALSHTSQTFPSVLYFEKRKEGFTTRLMSRAGTEAVEAYLEAHDKGRLMQSLKAFLGDEKFEGTEVFGRRFTLDSLIAVLLRHVLSSASHSVGAIPRRAVVGRPVHFTTPATDSSDQVATNRLLAAVKQCGVEQVIFEYEPVAAAYTYAQSLERDELIFIGDFGGGTSDFSILRVGPSVRQRVGTRQEVLGTGGVALAGDAFDRRIIRNVVAPRLGLGSQYISPPQKFLPIPEPPYERLERWQYLSIPDAKTLNLLERVRPTALIPERIEAFVYLIRHQLGYQLYEAVRRVKFQLSEEEEALFEFDCGPVRMRHKVTRANFERWIEPELIAISESIDQILKTSAVSPGDVDRVFLTGGSSFVPAVRQLFVERFGSTKMAGGDELTSVAKGLALRAAEASTTES